MAIAIYTLIDGTNYGQRLQNLALQTVLEQITGSRVETVGYYRPLSGKYQDTLSLRNRVSYLAYEALTLHYPLARLWRRFWQRTAFYRFNRDRIHMAPRQFAVGEENIAAPNYWSERYDGFIAGSDQIWNLDIPTVTPLAFLRFARPGQRYSYAASVCCAPEVLDKTDWAREGLREMDGLSVREDVGLDTVEQITGRRPVWDLDPALLLDADAWNKLLALPAGRRRRPYILVYQIDSSADPALEPWARAFADARGWQVVRAREISCGPAGWVRLVRDASLVVADSYHGLIFSLLFRVPFVLSSSRGEGMNTRLSSLLNRLELPPRHYDCMPDTEILEGVDWQAVHARLAGLRRESLEHLENTVARLEGRESDACAVAL